MQTLLEHFHNRDPLGTMIVLWLVAGFICFILLYVIPVDLWNMYRQKKDRKLRKLIEEEVRKQREEENV